MIIYADTSALAAVYLGDHDAATTIAAALYERMTPVVTSELADVEIASAMRRAQRDGRIGRAQADYLLGRYTIDTNTDGPLGVIPLRSETLALAAAYVTAAPLRSLDAIHLAACTTFAEAIRDEVRLLTLDVRQREGAEALGIALHL